jgi:hypothetical protein
MIIYIVITDMVFLKKDWKMCFTIGTYRTGSNWLGFKAEGHLMYSVAGWTTYETAIGIFFIKA